MIFSLNFIQTSRTLNWVPTRDKNSKVVKRCEHSVKSNETSLVILDVYLNLTHILFNQKKVTISVNPNQHKINLMKMLKYLLLFWFIFLIGCSDTQEVKRPLKSTYVPPTTNYKGQFRKGYVRKSVSTNPNALRNQTRSKYYYQTKGKYRRKRKT